MKFRYRNEEEMKDSGVEWLGGIPKCWNRIRIGHLCELGRGRVISNEEIMDNKGVYPVYSSQTKENGVMGYINTYDFNGEYVTWTTDGANAGTVFKRSGKFNCTNVCGTLKNINSNLYLSFLAYSLSTETKPHVRLDINPKLMNNEMANIKICVTNIPEQILIANFLDEKTAQFDTIISKKEDLIKRLEEAKKSLISEVVTGKVKVVKTSTGYELVERKKEEMKDSGVEWLGDIPKEWNISKLKYVGESITGLTYSPNDIVDTSNGILVLRSSNVQNGKIELNDNVYVDMKIQSKLITRVGDILICSRNGSRKLIGKNACIREEHEGNSFGAFMTIFRSKYFEYLNFVFNSELFKAQAGSFLTSTINQLTIGNLNSFIIPLPNKNQQDIIVEYLKMKVLKFEKIIENFNVQIIYLKEAKQSLISEAVTGKIEVLD